MNFIIHIVDDIIHDGDVIIHDNALHSNFFIRKTYTIGHNYIFNRSEFSTKGKNNIINCEFLLNLRFSFLQKKYSDSIYFVKSSLIFCICDCVPSLWMLILYTALYITKQHFLSTSNKPNILLTSSSLSNFTKCICYFKICIESIVFRYLVFPHPLVFDF